MEEWRTYNWGDLITLEYGKPVPDKESVDGNVPVFGTNGQIGTSHLKPLCPFPSVIIGRKGAYRGVHYSDKPFSVIDTGFYMKPLVKGLNLKWAYYKFLTYDINRMDSGSAIPSTDRYELYKIPVNLPSLEEQNRVVSVLDSIDNKIELNNRINHNLEEQARNIFLSYIERDSVECSFSKVITVGSGGTPRTSEPRFWNGIIPFFSPKDVTNACFTLVTEKSITDDGLNNCNSSLFPENTTFITARGTVGKIALAGVPMAMNQSCFALTPKDNTPYFTYFLTERVVESLKKKANGAVFDAINSKDILQELTRVPNRDVIFQIENRIRPYMDSIKSKCIENLSLTETRDNLLPKLMSGELSINEIDL